jgi:uncharacterized protein YdhG (YjbR/CyaY superfamily)
MKFDFMVTTKVPQTIDDYIADCSTAIQQKLNELRITIKKAAPDAQEKISWAMPTFTFKGNLVHFAAHTNHIGFYAGISPIIEFEDELKDFKTTKGGIQLPNNKPLPLDLVSKIVRFRVKENLMKAELKLKKR